jgi:hypothetical protein
MAYTANIPQGPQLISVTQPLIQANFNELDNYTQVDHVPLNDANQGKHAKVTFREQTADPTTLPNEVALYTKDVAGSPSLFIRQQNDGTVSRFDSITTNPGRVFLPNGLVMAFGNQASVTNGTVISFGAAFAFTTVLSIQLTAIRPNPSRVFLHINSNTTSSVTIRLVDQNDNPGPASTIYWTAIGIV